MGSRKKERGKARKALKAEVLALKQAVDKAQVSCLVVRTSTSTSLFPFLCRSAHQPPTNTDHHPQTGQACAPEAATALLAADSLVMTLPPPSNGPDGASPLRLRFEYHTPASLPKAWREPLFQVRPNIDRLAHRRPLAKSNQSTPHTLTHCQSLT
jgi:hypothetical protein